MALYKHGMYYPIYQYHNMMLFFASVKTDGKELNTCTPKKN